MVHLTTATAPVPVLKTSVLQCIEALSCDPNVSPFLRDLLHLIRHYLFDVDKQSRLASELLVQILRQLYQQCVHMPAYTVALPRPRKPPLSTKLIYCESKNHYVNLSTYSNPLNTETTTRIALAYIAGSRNTTLKDPLHRDLTMALHSGAPSSSQWLEDFIQQQQQQLDNFQPDLDLSTQGHSSDVFQLGISQETHPLRHNGPHSGQRRAFSHISDPDEQDSHGRTKFPKRGEPHQRNLQAFPLPTYDSISSYTSNAQHHPSPAATASEHKLFACPFSKRTEHKFINTKDWKCCLGPGPGWTIHRLKEHLYRKHASANYQCPRCLIEFEDVSDLHQHQRSTTPCLIQTNNEAGIDRIDTQQMIQLKKKSRRRSDEEKWCSIYRIIFRLDAKADIPSPYYEDIVPIPNIEPSSHYGDNSLSQFQSYLQNRLHDCHQTQQNTSTIQACMDLVQGFQKTRGDISLPVSEAPSLLFNSSTFSSMAYEYQPSTSTTLSTAGDHNLKTSHEFGGTDINALNGLGLRDDTFETRFDKVFGTVAPEASPKPLPNRHNFQQREGLG